MHYLVQEIEEGKLQTSALQHFCILSSYHVCNVTKLLYTYVLRWTTVEALFPCLAWVNSIPSLLDFIGNC